MSDRTKTVHDIPSIGNSGLRVAPIGTTSRFMELHKLDYKRNTLLNKLENSEREIKNVKRHLTIIEHEMANLLGNVDVGPLSEEEGAKSQSQKSKKSQLLKY